MPGQERCHRSPYPGQRRSHTAEPRSLFPVHDPGTAGNRQKATGSLLPGTGSRDEGALGKATISVPVTGEQTVSSGLPSGYVSPRFILRIPRLLMRWISSSSSQDSVPVWQLHSTSCTPELTDFHRPRAALTARGCAGGWRPALALAVPSSLSAKQSDQTQHHWQLTGSPCHPAASPVWPPRQELCLPARRVHSEATP